MADELVLSFHVSLDQLLLAHVAALCWISEAHSQSRDPALNSDSARGEITVEANGATLGRLLGRLFT
jgi:hypothetical protein